MPFDIESAVPVKGNEQGAEEIGFGFDINSAKPVSYPEEATFRVLDSSNVLVDTAKALFAGIERIPATLGYAMEFLGRDIVSETKSPTIPIVPFYGIKSIPWLRRPKPSPNKIDTAIDNFFIKFGSALTEIGDTVKKFYNDAANKGIESPNPAIMMGWKHPFRKTLSLSAENFPMLALAAGVSTVTGSPIAGAATFFPRIAGDFYEDAISHGVDPLKATDLATIDGAVQTALENIVLGNWMKGGHLLKRVFRTALQEGLIEEGSQQAFENSLKILNWKDSRPVTDRLLDGLAESILAGAVSGGALGSFQAPNIDDIRYDLHNDVIKEGTKQGLTDEEISQTIDKVDEIIDKITGKELIQPEITSEAKQARILKGIVNILPEDIEHVKTLAKQISEGEAGKRMPVRDAEGTITEWIGVASTFPKYFSNKGYTKKQALSIINKILEGKPITEKQQAVFEDLLAGYKEQLEQEVKIYEQTKEEDKFRAELKEYGYSESEIEDIIRLAQEDAQDEIVTEGIGISGSKFFKTSDEANAYIEKAESLGGQAKIVHVSPDEVEVSYVLPETLTPNLEIKQEEGEVFKKSYAAYAIAPGEEMPQERQPMGKGEPKYIPPKTAIGVMEWEKTEAWKVNLGRDITGVFEREIGPKLQVSKRLKRWLGVYYPTLGPSGLIRVKTLSDEMTLFHEAGHFLDDSLSGLTGWNVGQRGIIREELLKVTHYVTPFEEGRIPIFDKETGLPKINKRTGKVLTKFDSYTNYRRQSKELFAQYLSLYVSNPVTAKELAPVFTGIVEQEIAKDQEFSYIVTKLREFEGLMKPIKEYVNSLRKIPDFQKDIRDWVERGNVLQQIWRSQVGDKVWNIYSKAIEDLGKKLHVPGFFEKGGLNDAVFEILRQRRKLIQGQQVRLKEELVDPISKFGKEDQQFIAESLQRFELLPPDNLLNRLTEEARKESTLWGNEARKLDLLNDEVFWNNAGQYFPFFYETKEFEKNKRDFGYFPSKAIRANLSSFKHKMTDEEFGIKVLEAQYGTWPSGKEKIAKYTKEQLEEIGQNAREELGLMKTAAYPLQRRLFSMIETIYTVKAFNNIAMLPGIIGQKGMEGYDKMPSGKKYGDLAEQYVPVELVKEVSKWNVMQSELGKIWRDANSVWKLFKVPYNPAAVSRNIVTNAIMAWFGDVPIYNPTIIVKGIKSFVAKDEAYQVLRDRGLYHNTYSEQELKALAFQIDEDPDNPYKQIQIWANKLSEAIHSPAYLYGAIEDASKTVIARYVLDNGGTPEQAVKFADKLLFDYSQVSEAVGFARQSFFPFITWSAKILPRLVEFAIRKPEKFALIAISMAMFNAFSRLMLGIDKDEEERLKPDYIRGKNTLLLPGRDINGDLNWIDLTYFMPWGNWSPINKGKLAVPQTLTMGGVLPILYNAFVLNYDPFTQRKIAEDYLSDDERIIEQGKYCLINLSPQILTSMLTGKLFATKPDRYGRKKELSKILAGELLGVKFVSDVSAYRKKIQEGLHRTFYEGRADIRKKVKTGELTKEQAEKKIKELKERLEVEKQTH
jgi:hypothetical protein